VAVATRFLLSSFLVACVAASGQQPPTVTPDGSEILEIRLTKPLTWGQGCLQVGIERVNRSTSPIVLPPTPFEGIRVYSSVADKSNSLGQGAGEAWVLVYGWTDVVYREPKTLEPGSAKQNTFCIRSSFPVKDRVMATTRQIALRGTLRIYAEYYQLPAGDKKEQAKNDSAGRTRSEVMLELPIPCSSGIDEAECSSPPPILPRETYFLTPVPEPPFPEN
jgi:hypothetical protein